MIDALLSGRLAADPRPGTARNGNAYVTARVLVTTNAEERLSVSVIAFEAAACTALLALGAGEAVTLAGELTPKVWTDGDGNARPSVDLKVHAVLTAYHVQRKRRAMALAMIAGDDDQGDEFSVMRIDATTKLGGEP